MKYKVCVSGVTDSVKYIDDLDDTPDYIKGAVMLLHAMDLGGDDSGFMQGSIEGVGSVFEAKNESARRAISGAEKAFFVLRKFLTSQSEECHVG